MRLTPARSLVLMMVLSLALRFFLIFQDIGGLLRSLLVDDAYYYYVVVQNILQGHGVVFNVGIVTNGFHPLYALLLLPLFSFFFSYGVNVPIYASLVLLSLFHVGTALFIYLIGKRLSSEGPGLLGAFMWLFSPYVLFVSLMGVEAALQIFFISALVYMMVSRRGLGRIDSVLIGLLLALSFLSRVDSAFLVLGTFLVLFWRYQKQKTVTLENIGIVALVSGLIVLPWLAWSFLQFGSIMPMSGVAFRHLRLISPEPYLLKSLFTVYTSLSFVSQFFVFSFSRIQEVVVSIFVLGFCSAFLFLHERGRFILKKLNFLFIGSVFYYLSYWFYQIGMRDWYSLYTCFLVALIFPPALFHFLRKKPRRIVIIGLAILFLMGGVLMYQHGNAPQEKTKWAAAQYIDEHLPEDVVIGSFNTGVYQYYARQEIINLDGVVNPEAYYALRDHRIEEYILEKGISYLIDEDSAVRGLNSSLLRVTLISTFDEGGAVSGLYEVQKV